MKTQNDLLVKELLWSEWSLLEASVETLTLSINKCSTIGVKNHYSFEEQESFDSLTSKFNRTSDLFTQKVIRTIWMLLHEPFSPFIDMMNLGEKMQILLSAEQMIEIRDMRNQIAHEYIPEAIRDLIPDVIILSEQLIKNIRFCRKFIEERNWLCTTNTEQ